MDYITQADSMQWEERGLCLITNVIPRTSAPLNVLGHVAPILHPRLDVLGHFDLLDWAQVVTGTCRKRKYGK